MTASTPAAAPRPLRLELLVNLAGTGWSALVQFACIPVFLAMLGAERYALLAFATTMSLSLKALDLGMSHTANRELAARTASGRTEGARELQARRECDQGIALRAEHAEVDRDARELYESAPPGAGQVDE